MKYNKVTRYFERQVIKQDEVKKYERLPTQVFYPLEAIHKVNIKVETAYFYSNSA
jgi:hypothetical protein